MYAPYSNLTVQDIKNLAKIRSKKKGLKLADAQREIAKEAGYRDWFHAEKELAKNEAAKSSVAAPAAPNPAVIKTYLVTAAILGDKVDGGFLASTETFLQNRHAEFVILGRDRQSYRGPLDAVIYERGHGGAVQNEKILAPALRGRCLDLQRFIKEPLCGLKELGADEGLSYLVAHVTQVSETYETGYYETNNRVKRVQQCTGALTKPSAIHPNKNHVVGGVIVEVLEGGAYRLMPVQAAADGSFSDGLRRYCPDGRVSDAA